MSEVLDGLISTLYLLPFMALAVLLYLGMDRLIKRYERWNETPEEKEPGNGKSE